MKINWRVRFTNKTFLLQLALSIIAPILAYNGMNGSELTTWAAVGRLFTDALGNPFVLALVFVSVANAVTDPTTAGLRDSARALNYKTLGGKQNDK